jgi:hypothetical protein
MIGYLRRGAVKIDRRQLLTGGVAALTTASATAQGLQDCGPCGSVNPPTPRSPNRKLRVKPVITNLIHTDVWEGPCRFNVVAVAKERENVQAECARWVKRVTTGQYTLGLAGEMLAPS